MAAKVLSVRNLQLYNYRNYKNLFLEISPNPVIITGDNGVGKTNILEAISLLTPGKGLRNAKLSEIDKNNSKTPWELYSLIEGAYATSDIIMKREVITEINDKRYIAINGEKIKTKAELTKIFGVIWLTPQMDNIFLLGSSERRRFFDRLVYNFDSEHASRVAKYEYFMRERNQILSNEHYDESWLTIIEAKMCEVAVAIAASRVEAIYHLQTAINESTSNFPKAYLAIEGELEKLIGEMPALQIEEYFKTILKNYRKIDATNGRTCYGPHRSDLIVTHVAKNQLACYCSTGEQKALLITIILADAKAKIKWNNLVPVILLDEVAAHLDEYRRRELFNELLGINCQFWLTGVDAEIFKELKTTAQFFKVKENQTVEI